MDHNKITSVMTKTNTIEIERNAKEDRGGAVWTKHKYNCDDKDKYNSNRKKCKRRPSEAERCGPNLPRNHHYTHGLLTIWRQY